jgi:hypothetical protein
MKAGLERFFARHASMHAATASGLFALVDFDFSALAGVRPSMPTATSIPSSLSIFVPHALVFQDSSTLGGASPDTRF